MFLKKNWQVLAAEASVELYSLQNLMATSLDMSLDDIIKKSRTNNGRFRGRGVARRGRGPVGGSHGGRMAGTVRRGPFRVNTQPSPYTIAKASSKLWMFNAIFLRLITLAQGKRI